MATRATGIGRLGWIVLAVVVLGGLIGVGAGLLTLLLYGIEHAMLGYVEDLSVPGPFAVPALRRAVSVTAGLSVAGVIWWLLRTRTAKVPSVKQAVHGARMPIWQTIVHVVLQIAIVGSGASIGREVAPRELGAMLAQRFCDLLRIDGERGVDRRLVVAVAAGAGLGGVYNAPLAGMFFAVEILLADATIETVAFALGTSSVAAFVATSIKGHHTFYGIGAMQAEHTPSLMLFAALGGILFGVAGALFRRGSQWAESHRPTGRAILWMMPLAGLLTGLVALAVPQVMGNGRAAAQLGFSTAASHGSGSSPWTLLDIGGHTHAGVLALVLLASFAAKAAVTLLTIRSGASDGVLQPGIALGSTLGATLGLAWVIAFPADSVTSCALIGAAALLSASQQAPLMAMCLVMELTEAPIGFFVPVGVAVAVSSLVSGRLLAWIGAREALGAKRSATHNK